MDSQSSWERQKETKEMTKENGSPIRSGMTEKSTDMIVELSFPNVSIGNPEGFIRKWIHLFSPFRESDENFSNL